MGLSRWSYCAATLSTHPGRSELHAAGRLLAFPRLMVRHQGSDARSGRVAVQDGGLAVERCGDEPAEPGRGPGAAIGADGSGSSAGPAPSAVETSVEAELLVATNVPSSQPLRVVVAGS